MGDNEVLICGFLVSIVFFLFRNPDYKDEVFAGDEDDTGGGSDESPLSRKKRSLFR